jgi:Nuclease-related domain
MNTFPIEPRFIAIGLAVVALAAGAAIGFRVYRRRARRRALLARLERISLQAVHQVEVPDGMGGFIHVDHLLLTSQGIVLLDTRRIPGLIFGGDQMSEWTVMARNRRYTFENPQPALYDRVAAVKALVGDVPVEGRLLFSNVGRFTKGKPKWVMMEAGLEVDFPVVDRAAQGGQINDGYLESWGQLTVQLRPSPHVFTSM